MRYFKAIELQDKPFIQWDCWANSTKELNDLGESGNPLIMQEKDIPPYEFGVCPLKIVGGQLVNRTESEMYQFELEFQTAQKIVAQSDSLNEVRNSVFNFDGKNFPMSDAARTYYAVVRDLNATAEVLTSDGILYELSLPNISAFYLAFNTKLKALLSPTRV